MPEAMVQLNSDTVAFEACPDSPEKLPAVLIMHEVTGLVDYVKEVGKKLAENGYLALAVDLYRGKTAQGQEDGAALREAVTDEVFQTKAGAAIAYLKANLQWSGKIGIVGFCMGGGNSLRTACLFGSDIQACSMFYGRISDMKLLEGLQCPVIGNFGGEDRGITEWAIHDLRPAMEHAGKSFNMKVYPGAPHGFHRHTAPNIHRPEAAQDAFERTLALFGRTLKPAGAWAGGWGR